MRQVQGQARKPGAGCGRAGDQNSYSPAPARTDGPGQNSNRAPEQRAGDPGEGGWGCQCPSGPGSSPPPKQGVSSHLTETWAQKGSVVEWFNWCGLSAGYFMDTKPVLGRGPGKGSLQRGLVWTSPQRLPAGLSKEGSLRGWGWAGVSMVGTPKPSPGSC